MKKLYLLLAGLVALTAAAAQPFEWQYQISGEKLTVSCQVPAGHYLYEREIVIKAEDAAGQQLKFTSPASQSYNDKLTGETVQIYPGPNIYRWESPMSGKLKTLQVDFQGCREPSADNPGMCMMPESLDLLTASSPKSGEAPVRLDSDLSAALAQFEAPQTRSGLLTAAEITNWIQGSSAAAAASPAAQVPQSFWAILVLVLFGGLSLNLTPCVLPMIPINLAIIGAGRAGASRWVGFRRGLAYALGITLAYGVLGVIAALTGARFGELNSSSTFNFVTGGIFILLSLGLFGVYEIDLAKYKHFFKSSRQPDKQPSFAYYPELSALGLGVLAALLAGACVAPVVISVVVLAAKMYSEGVMLALGLPFALGLAMALPWPLAGAGMAVLPQPGKWMKKVNIVMGSIVLLTGVYYGYLGWSLRGGNYDARQELARLTAQLEEAAESRQTVLVDCYASWCKNCRELEKTLHSAPVQAVLKDIKVIRFQAEKLNDPALKNLLDKWQIPGLPSLVLLKFRNSAP